jgi:hypothetical protein
MVADDLVRDQGEWFGEVPVDRGLGRLELVEEVADVGGQQIGDL